MNVYRPPGWYAPLPGSTDTPTHGVQVVRGEMPEGYVPPSTSMAAPVREDGHMDLVEFLRARLDEDEAAAKAWLPYGNPTAEQREHIARHDPARVLAEVEAKRQRIADYLKICELADPVRHPEQAYVLAKGAMERTLKLDALPYASDPAYREEWKP